MTIQRILASSTLGVALVCTAVGMAQGRPEDNVRAKNHPNLAAAQRLSTQAYERLDAAQRANEFDLGGHAQKAKELLDQANREMSQAAGAANEEHREKH